MGRMEKTCWRMPGRGADGAPQLVALELHLLRHGFDGESALVRELLDIARGRQIHETIATQGKGVVELLDAILG